MNEASAQPEGWDVYLDRVTKRYGRVAAVDAVTLGVGSGQLLALLGPSGCGKTTTLRIVAGLTQPSSGDVYIKGSAVTRTPVHRRNVGVLFQNYALFPHLSVAENVAFGLQMRRLAKDEIRRKVGAALRMVQLDGYEERMPHQLSGGQQQRVALARALVIQPSVLLLDEPLGALDRKLRETMQIELKALQGRLGVTTILVTHDQEEALTLADRIAVMRDGRIEQLGTPAEIYQRPVSRFVADFIGTSNFFTGRVVERAGGQIRVAADAGVTLALDAADGLAPGDSATVAVRPESVRISREHGAGGLPNAVRVRVEQVVYRGHATHCYARLPGGALLVAVQQDDDDQQTPARPGEELVFRWDAARSRVVRED